MRERGDDGGESERGDGCEGEREGMEIVRGRKGRVRGE